MLRAVSGTVVLSLGLGLIVFAVPRADGQDQGEAGKAESRAGAASAKLLEKYPDADKDGDGKLSSDELRELHQKRRAERPGGSAEGPGSRPEIGPMSDSMRTRTLERYPEADADKDGKLSDEEFKKARESGLIGRPDAASFRPPVMFFDWLNAHFDEADADKNGQLSKDEIGKLKQKYAIAAPGGDPFERYSAQMLQRFPEADTNGDGKLTREEFEAFREKNPDALRRGMMDRVPQADTDGDGKVSDEEMKAARERARDRAGERPDRGERRERRGGRGNNGGGSGGGDGGAGGSGAEQ